MIQKDDNFITEIGSPDLIILFTNTVSHKMKEIAVSEAKTVRGIGYIWTEGCFKK